MRAFFVLLFIVLVGCAPAPGPEPDVLPEGSPEPVVEAPRRSYIGDIGSKVFHREGCPEIEKVELSKQRLLETAGEAANDGFAPCKVCEPYKGW